MISATVIISRRLPRRHDSWWLILALSIACLGSVACGGAPEDEPEEIPTVDVPPALSVNVEDDPQATPEAAKLVGVLPEDYPSDLPLYLPASLIDFGTAENGSRFVTLLSSGRRATVAPEVESLMRENGWAPASSGHWRKGSRQVRLRIEDGQPGTIYHYEY